MRDRADIAIIGSGAAGLAAAIFAAEAAAGIALRIVLLDAAGSVGAKILISGGGRCNVTHQAVAPQDYHANPHIVRNILAALPVQATIKWFASLGVDLTEEETGKLFPVTNKARTVLQALTTRCEALGVSIRCRHRVSDVRVQEGTDFCVKHEQGELVARRVIMATGGRSLPRTGSDGLGWQIARRLGHCVGETYPALVPLVLDPSLFHAKLSGLSQSVELTTWVNGVRVDHRAGSLLWTHFGVSGPVVMDASRFWSMAIGEKQSVELRCNFWPGMDTEGADRMLLRHITARPRSTVAKLLAQQWPERFAEAISCYCGITPSLPASQLSKPNRRALAQSLTRFVLPVVRDRGWNYAEVTAGGVPLEEIDFRSMESRVCPGLYFIGEMLDCDGRIGGFNFQWAWATGFLAGRKAVASLRRTHSPASLHSDSACPRYSAKPFPPYRFIPGRSPHPRRHPHGYAFSLPEPLPRDFSSDRWWQSEDYLYGIDLYNQGYWWESHEVFEALWHHVGRDTVSGQFFRALIQVAAANLKHSMGILGSAQRLWQCGLDRLAGIPTPYQGLHVTEFTADIHSALSGRSVFPAAIRLSMPPETQ
jgi:predicted Rossmann fold flavoprotein